MDQNIHDRRSLEMDLATAVERSEFGLYYQPIFDLNTGLVAGTEALVHWHHPSRGTIVPNLFVAIAEETGLIVQIGRMVLEQACRDALLMLQHWLISVNLSAVQFIRDDVVAFVEKTLTKMKLAAHRLGSHRELYDS